MFRYIAEDIAFLLIKSKAVNIEERDVYVFGLEVLLLNFINVLTALIISLISGTMWHFAAFMLIFAPLRIFSGGYHAKHSETCFVISTLVYIASVLTLKLYPLFLHKHSCGSSAACFVCFTDSRSCSGGE